VLRNNVLIFVKSMIMVQLFFIVLLAGVSLDINRIIWQENSFVNRLGEVAPGIQVNLNEQRAETLLRQVNIGLTGTDQWPWQKSTFLSWTLPRQMMASNIQVLASNGLEVPRNTELDAQPGTFDLPAIVQTDPSSFPSLTTEDTLHLKGREVALYCTHSAETYTPDSGKPKLDGKHGLINKVARQLAGTDFLNRSLGYTVLLRQIHKLIHRFNSISYDIFKGARLFSYYLNICTCGV
jgi:stage II sporulation protein P